MYLAYADDPSASKNVALITQELSRVCLFGYHTTIQEDVHFKNFDYRRQLREAVCAGVTENIRPCASAHGRNFEHFRQ